MYVLDSKNRCTGCGACSERCPKGAIKMEPDEEGFIYPVIDADLCVECNLCRKICPQNGKDFVNAGDTHFYGGVISDSDTLMRSSSGGAFSAICAGFDSSAIVCGSCYDSELKVHHSCTENTEQIDKFRKSKYLQSKMGDVYPQIRDCIREGKTVIFTGTACQVAGLYAYLGEKPENLYTVDLVCHGVPSQMVFDRYIESLSRKEKMKIKSFSFREKSYFWGDWEIGVAYSDGKKRKYHAWGQDSYMSGFLRGLFYRPVCYSCKYANSEINRPADLTIGDFWGSQTVKNEYQEKKGSSLIVVNSEKGSHMLEKAMKHMDLTEVSRETAVKENHNLIEPTKYNQGREQFFSKLCSGTDFIEIMDQILKGKAKSHSQKIRVIVSKLFPYAVNARRKKIIEERKNR